MQMKTKKVKSTTYTFTMDELKEILTNHVEYLPDHNGLRVKSDRADCSISPTNEGVELFVFLIDEQ